jgi:hypothetical protein
MCLQSSYYIEEYYTYLILNFLIPNRLPYVNNVAQTTHNTSVPLSW